MVARHCRNEMTSEPMLGETKKRVQSAAIQAKSKPHEARTHREKVELKKPAEGGKQLTGEAASIGTEPGPSCSSFRVVPYPPRTSRDLGHRPEALYGK